MANIVKGESVKACAELDQKRATLKTYLMANIDIDDEDLVIDKYKFIYEIYDELDVMCADSDNNMNMAIGRLAEIALGSLLQENTARSIENLLEGEE